MPQGHTSVAWLFGRGCSIAAGLTWEVPKEWRTRPRDEQIELIKPALEKASAASSINLATHHACVEQLAGRSPANVVHTFVTTNWDILLERTLLEVFGKTHPRWLDNTYVAHINGSIEKGLNPAAVSPFLLETDDKSQRKPSPEADKAFNLILWSQVVVVLGMSFECQQDRFLLEAINRVEDDMPVGGATWIVVNSTEADCAATCKLIQGHMRHSTVVAAVSTFQDWVKAGMPEVARAGCLKA